MPEDLSREELIELLAQRDATVAAQVEQIATLMRANADLSARLAEVEHLLSRNSGNSLMPPSGDDGPGKTAPAAKSKPKTTGEKRKRGKQPGAKGSHLAWTEHPTETLDVFPQRCCGCGEDLAGATDLGIVDRFQQHEIPLVSVTVMQYNQHQVRCGCGREHVASRPEGARSGSVEYGPNLQALIVYLLVMHHLPVQRCVALLEALTGAKPSAGFVHGMLGRAAGMFAVLDARIRTLLTLARVVSCDETPIRVGPRTPREKRKKADMYLLVACTDRLTHYLLGDRDLPTFEKSVLTDLTKTGAVIVHDRYAVYDNKKFAGVRHQLCTQHLLRDLTDAGEVYPDALWPKQIADALRGLIHQANLARAAAHACGRSIAGLPVTGPVIDRLIGEFISGVKVGLSDTTSNGNRPGEHKARLVLEALRDRRDDVLRFVTDLEIPPTSNQAERDLRPGKMQQNVSGRLTSVKRTADRYLIRGAVSTAIKHGRNAIHTIRGALVGNPWLPPPPTPA